MNYILGVINKSTNKYENIIVVDKSNKYKCIGCDSDLILRKGEIRFQSFVHKNTKSCNYFRNPTEDQLLNDAKMHLQVLIEQIGLIFLENAKDAKKNVNLSCQNMMKQNRLSLTQDQMLFI